MKIPPFDDLSEEQDEICVLAPLDEVILVSGPPGTGKTVVAFYRAEAVSGKGCTPVLVMYNAVLCRYSHNASNLPAVREGVKTWFSWFGRWWKVVFGQYYPQKGPYIPDWEPMLKSTVQLVTDPQRQLRAFREWGHLIVDEGQDFPCDFYHLARLVLNIAESSNVKKVSLTVLADENQRLQAGKNSSIKEIKQALAVKQERHYHLTRNYRNTYEIARAAAHFYVGLPDGIPKLPVNRRGQKPRITRTENLDASVDLIRRFVVNQSDLEIGVFLPTQALQIKYYNELKRRLRDVAGVNVQRYTNNDHEHGDANRLQFDTHGVVTVLCDQSSKGLEFDVVFVPEIQARRWDPVAIDQFRMQFYVLTSRARQFLFFQYTSKNGDQIPILDHFPRPDSDIMEWING
ncbi:MAG: hypothetical protein M5R41_19300 [Bacteroidia bacterium]|nr:hypothetical protein [Bacteroidia bacterium]